MLVLEIVFRTIMSGQIVPNDNCLFAVIMMDLRQEKNEVFRIRRSLDHRPEILDGKAVVKLEKMAVRCPGNVTDARMIVSPGRFEENRRMTDGSPSANAIRHEGKSAFIPENQDISVGVRFFLMRGQS